MVKIEHTVASRMRGSTVPFAGSVPLFLWLKTLET